MEMDDYRKALEEWKRKELRSALDKRAERRDEFTSVSNQPVPRLTTPLDLREVDPLEDIGLPGRFPFTRGPYPTMYRGKLWTMRQFAGFGTAADTNRRYHYLLEHGQTGLSVAFDMPTLMGYDSDHPLARGEIGRCGVAVSSLADMETLFHGIPLGEITTSMTINGPAIVLQAMYLAVAEKQGVPPESLGGTIQADILKEYIAQKEWLFPPRPSMRVLLDLFVYSARHLPRWHMVSISGYHIREAGSSAVQELAFTLADGLEYVKGGIEAGLRVDEFAPRLSFFFNSHNDFFEEIAKLRAARRIWAREMKRRFRPERKESLQLRTHVQTAGCSLTAQQPYVNVVRTTIQALAGVLGGAQSLHTNALDETLALPTEENARLALRTQQVLAHESGVANTVDPLGGSYYVESLTSRMEEAAMDYIRRIDEMGGMLTAVEQGFPQREIADHAYWYQQAVDRGEKLVVGVNAFQVEDEPPIGILRIDPRVEKEQCERLARLRKERDAAAVERSLEAVRRSCRDGSNLFGPVLEAVKAYATLGEICQAMKDELGEYRDPGYF